MANTEALLKLIALYPTAFAPTDEAPPLREPDEESGTGETPQMPFSDELTDGEWCQHYLQQIEHEPRLMAIAAKVLEELATISDVRGSVLPTPVALVELPETFARQGTAECPSGVCPLDR
jgi:hypothetical protein